MRSQSRKFMGSTCPKCQEIIMEKLTNILLAMALTVIFIGGTFAVLCAAYGHTIGAVAVVAMIAVFVAVVEFAVSTVREKTRDVE